MLKSLIKENKLSLFPHDILSKLSSKLHSFIIQEEKLVSFDLLHIYFLIQNHSIFNFDEFRELVQQFHTFSISESISSSVNALYNLILSFSHIISSYSFPESMFHLSITIGLRFYFSETAGPQIQTASSKLLCGIFRSQKEIRNSLFNDLLLNYNSKSLNKIIIIDKDQRKTISSFSRLCFDLVHSISTFEETKEEEINDTILFFLSILI
jgi:hypothetical protein